MKISIFSTIKAGTAAILAFAAMPALATLPIYPSAGTQNPTPYTITAATNGTVLAYFASNTGGFTNLLGLNVNGIDTGILGLNNQTSTPGDVLNFGLVNAGDVLTFYINVTDTNDVWYSNKALNSDGVNHVWSTTYTGGDFGIPAGQFMTFEDLPGGGDFNYGDLGFVFTNVTVTPGAVPEPASWMMLIVGFGLIGAAMRRSQVSVTYA